MTLQQLLTYFSGDTYALADSTPFPKLTDTITDGITTVADHIFQLRRIQSKISGVEGAENNASQNGADVQNLWHTDIGFELRNWKATAPYSQTNRGDPDLHTVRRFNILYSYSVIALFPNPKLAIKDGDAHHILRAAICALLDWKKNASDGETYYTWTAVR